MSTSGGQRATAGVDGHRRCVGCSAVLATDNTARLCARCYRDQRDQLRTPPVQVSDEFWSTDDFRAAFDSQHIGRVCKAYRHHPRHLQLFGKALNQEHLGRWLGLTQAQVSKLENGKPEQNLEMLRAYAQILRIPQRMLWFDFPGQTRIVEREDSIGRLSNLALLASPLDGARRPRQHDYPVPPTSSAVPDDDPVGHIRRLTDARVHFEQMYRSSGGLVAGARIEQFLTRQMLSIVATSGGTGEVEMKSRRAMGSLVALSGVCAYDGEDWITAHSRFAQALAIAESSRDHDFHAYVMALMANQALALEDYKTAETLADMGLRSCGKAPATSLTIDLRVMRAKALASSGDGPAARSVILMLEADVSRLPKTDGIAEASYAQEGHLQAQLAEALSSLGDLTAAQRYAEQSLLSEGHARGKVNRLASMATLEVARGEIERASDRVCQMIDSARGMESQRLVSRFKKLRAALASRNAVASRDTMDRLDSAITLML
jgi:transcriptional regulator with XRE-family HTH domain